MDFLEPTIIKTLLTRNERNKYKDSSPDRNQNSQLPSAMLFSAGLTGRGSPCHKNKNAEIPLSQYQPPVISSQNNDNKGAGQHKTAEVLTTCSVSSNVPKKLLKQKGDAVKEVFLGTKHLVNGVVNEVKETSNDFLLSMQNFFSPTHDESYNFIIENFALREPLLGEHEGSNEEDDTEDNTEGYRPPSLNK